MDHETPRQYASRDADVLIVDDRVENLRLLSEMLKQHGYRVRPVTSGKLALQAAEREPPDLILLDVLMPEMNGYEVCERLKSSDLLRKIPVIFLSALTEMEDKVQAFKAGGVDYITKPFEFEEVEARVSTHLTLRQLQTELESQNQRLQEQYDHLQELESLRDGLTHMIVHDLRSPLMGIMNLLDLVELNRSALDEATMRYVDSMATAASRMEQIVTDLLDVGRLESQQMPLNFGDHDLMTLVTDALDSLGGLIVDRVVNVDGPSGELRVSCDGQIVQRVISNLVGNAVKFTPRDGRVRIVLSREADTVRVSVIDSGPGISPEFHDRIFEKFGQVSARSQGQFRSTGLGLTFCKLAVEAHGGTIGLNSSVSEGATFWFVLPATEGPTARTSGA